MNVLWVCGVLRLDENQKSPAAYNRDPGDDLKSQEFDAWPTEEAKEKTKHAKRLYSKYAEICSFGGELPEEWWEYDSDETCSLQFHDESTGGESNDDDSE